MEERCENDKSCKRFSLTKFSLPVFIHSAATVVRVCLIHLVRPFPVGELFRLLSDAYSSFHFLIHQFCMSSQCWTKYKPNFLTEVATRAILIEITQVCPKGVPEFFEMHINDILI